MNVPSVVKFVKGKYRGLTLAQGSGPGKRETIDNNISFLRNSKNFWYGDNNLAISYSYLEHNKNEWVEATE